MAIFNKTKKAAISPAPNKAAAAGGFAPGYSSSNVGVNMIGQYYTYREGEARKSSNQRANDQPCARSYGLGYWLDAVENVQRNVERR
jgi:hypothetical protein